MTCDAASLCVVDLHGGLRADLRAFNVEKVDIVRQDVNACKSEESIGALSMEPFGFVQRQEAELWAYEAH